MVTISNVANAVCSASKAANNPIKLSHSQQLVAAALGYKSLAAYQASKEECVALDEAKHFFLDDEVLSLRAQALKLTHTLPELQLLLQAAFKDRLSKAHVHSSEADFDDYLRGFVNDVVLNDEEMCGSMAMTNNDGIGEIYLPIDDIALSELPPLGDALELSVDGHVSMEIDVERPYSGHKIDVEARLIIERKGRRCIAELICEVDSAKLDYDW